jgi:Zn finger protein HypA/HybF involved in hydrogenase expression
MASPSEVASALLVHLQAQLPTSGFQLVGIEVRVGTRVDVDAEVLRAALCAALPGVEVRLSVVEPVLRCVDCGAEYPHDEHPCPACGSARAEEVGGTELEISRAWGARVGG